MFQLYACRESIAMRILITGIQGFLGYHLSRYLQEIGVEVYGIQRTLKPVQDERARIYECDILDETALKKVINDVSPSRIFHLAAQSIPTVSWQEPVRTLEVNIIGTLTILKLVCELNLKARVVFVGSSSEYAASLEPISEDHPLKPSSLYALSKISGSLLCGLYHDTYAIDTVTMRPFFIIGPRKTGDVCSSFARGIVNVERGRAKTLTVGNLQSVRDFLDVEDATRAFWLVSEKGQSGQVYNVSSGKGTRIAEILELLKPRARVEIPVEQGQQARPIDNPVAIGRNDKLRSLGWTPTIRLEDSLSKILQYWRDLQS